MTELLFSYGTLRMDNVQHALFGRTVAMTPDTLSGYAITTIETRDPDAVATSGIETHFALVAEESAPPIEGMLLRITQAELASADTYEGADYVRVPATFGSGAAGWVYIRA